jgi:hypothetical protein
LLVQERWSLKPKGFSETKRIANVFLDCHDTSCLAITEEKEFWIPAYAGMTEKCGEMTEKVDVVFLMDFLDCFTRNDIRF